ncbi:MAG: hypothetical protein ACRDO2_07335 [Nocardioidaceae bacterium]|jgi:hypothetical protein
MKYAGSGAKARAAKVGVAALAVVAPLAMTAGSAQACGGCDDGDITVRVSDETPASGQQFIARGKLTMGGLPAEDHVVKVQTYRDGAWEQITGARVLTNDEGKYRVRLILSMKGKRLLRVVGVGQGDEPTERQRFTVRVH